MLSLSLLVLGVLLPVGVVAQAPAGTAYSGVAEGDVAELLLAPTPGQPAALEVTLGETTGAVNSAANIIPDSPGSPENEAEDFSVGTATPLRLASGGEIIAQPFSVQSSAPADAGGSNALLDINEPPVTLQVTRAETQSQAAEDASTAATQNDVEIATARLQGLALLPAGRTNADVSRAADGTVTGFADSAVDAPTTLLGDPATGDALITAQAITAVSNSNANGTTSANTTDFNILGLAIAGMDGVTIDAVPAPDPAFVRVTVRIAGQEALTADVPRGVNLLDPANFPDPATGGADLPLGGILAGLEPVLTPLVGPGGALAGTSLILGGGFSEQGDGTFARGLVEAVRIQVTAANAPITSVVVGRAFTEVNAVQANAVDFSSVQRATPAETIFTNPVPQPPEPEPEPEPEPKEKEEEPPEEAEPDPPAEVDEELPFTGLGLAAVAGMGGLMFLGGSLIRRISGRRGVDALGDEDTQ